MTSISKDMYIDKLINKYNKTYHRAIKMKRVDVNPSMYIDFNKENNNNGPKFKVGNHVRMSKYKNMFARDYIPNWSEVFAIKKVKKTLSRGHMIFAILKEHFTKKIANNKSKRVRVEKVIQEKATNYMLNGKYMIISLIVG